MNWNQAIVLINANIVVGMCLDPALQYRYVVQIPPYPCFRYGFNGLPGFRIQVGSRDYIEVPIIMLQNLYSWAKAYGGIYDRQIFHQNYPYHLKSKSCFVHSVGKLFEQAGIAIQLNAHQYRLL